LAIDRPPLVVICGPTASGKSALAMALSRLAPATIVNADASQVYADLRILTARPSLEDEAENPHRLFGHIDGTRAYSAAEWAEDAKIAIADAHAAQRLPILVGGTGLYIRTLLDGIAPVPPIDPAVRQAVRAMPVSDAYAALQTEDPQAAARLNPSDKTRIARALEVVRSTGRPLAQWHARREGGIAERVRIAPMVLLPPRDWLKVRIAERTQAIVAGGAAEAEALIKRQDIAPEMPVRRAIGVPEMTRFIYGDIDASEVEAAIVLATGQYAKRQYTWFRHQPPAHWPRHIEQPDDELIEQIAIKLRESALTA
jgi:tRNA dimethylallyltransferase